MLAVPPAPPSRSTASATTGVSPALNPENSLGRYEYLRTEGWKGGGKKGGKKGQERARKGQKGPERARRGQKVTWKGQECHVEGARMSRGRVKNVTWKGHTLTLERQTHTHTHTRTQTHTHTPTRTQTH